MNWSNLAGFLMVAVPSIMVATHVGAGLIGMVRHSLVMAQARQIVCDALAVKDNEDDQHEAVITLDAKPYATHDEWRQDVRYGNLEVVIRRSRKGIPPRPEVCENLSPPETSEDRSRMDVVATNSYANTSF